VIIALIVSEEGFPFALEVLDGNRTDVTTLDDILNFVEHKYGVARRIWVFDRGVVSEKNLKILRTRKTPYVVGTPRSALKDYEKELRSSDWQKIREEVEVHQVPPGETGAGAHSCRLSGLRLVGDAETFAQGVELSAGV